MLDPHERRRNLAHARHLILEAVFSILTESYADDEPLMTVEIARRLDWVDFYDTIRDVLRVMKQRGFVVDLNERGGYRQWMLVVPDDD